jgi:hypothetical protein
MRIRGGLFLAALLCHAPGSVVVAQASRVGDASHWFYLVKSLPSDPASEAEYNTWYDDIDIPDVLAVPGFLRARRGIAQDISAESVTGRGAETGTYVALYDIATNDIDKTIIDMYVAARKMAALGRTTDAFKIVEANYYRRLGQPHDVGGGKSAAVGDRYIYAGKILCCREPSVREGFLDWYRRDFVEAVVESDRVQRVSLYELYRVMEVLAVPPGEVPHLLIVFELSARTATDAVGSLEHAIESLRAKGHMHQGYVEGPATLYRQMSDVAAR